MQRLLDADITARLNTMRILWGSLIGTTLVFVGLALEAPAEEVAFDPVIVGAISVVSVMVLVVSVLFPARMEKRLLAAMPAEIVESAATDVNVPSALAKHTVARSFAAPKEALSRAMGCVMTPFILRMALREAIGIYGLVLAYMGQPFVVALPFLVVSFMAQLTAFPSITRIADDLEAAKGASLGPRT